MLDQLFTGTEVAFQLARFFLVMIVGILVTRTFLMPGTGKLMSRRDSSKKARHSLENMAGLTGLFLTLLVALEVASFGSLVTILGTLGAAITVAIGFGMRDQVSSLVAGVFIHTDNPFIKGDYIKFNETEGRVTEIRLRATTLYSGEQRKIVPNNLLTTNTVQNFSRGHRTSDSISFSVQTEKASEASELLLEVLQENEDVLERPEPELNYQGIEEGKMKLHASYWMRESTPVQNLRSRILKEFNSRAEGKNFFAKDEE